MKRFLKHIQNFLDLVRRLLMGKFWFSVGKLPNTNERIFVNRDLAAIPRSDPYWREQWRWVVLRVQDQAPFHIYFDSFDEGLCKRYFRKIRTPYVAMRVGPNAMMVAVIHSVPHRTDTSGIDVFIELESKSRVDKALAKRFLSHKVTWI